MPTPARLKWHFQFTPHDVHDWDATHTPILIDETIAGTPRKLVAVANRNGFFYTLDRVTGQFLRARSYTKVTWATHIDERGRPVLVPNMDPSAEGTRVCPSGTGGTNWHSPSYSPMTRLMYFFSNERCDTFMADDDLEPPHRAGRPYIGSAFFPDPGEPEEGAVRAVDPTTGATRWEFRQFSGAWAGVTATAGGLVFTGDGQGNFIALDAERGATCGTCRSAPRFAPRPSATRSTGGSSSRSRPATPSSPSRCRRRPHRRRRARAAADVRALTVTDMTRAGTVLLFATAAVAAVSSSGCDRPGIAAAPTVRYEEVTGWPTLPAGMQMGEAAGVAVDAHGHVFVFHRPGRGFDPAATELLADPAVLVYRRRYGTADRVVGRRHVSGPARHHHRPRQQRLPHRRRAASGVDVLA